ncbi:DUF192 domain-containing protein [Alcanivorax quisquiliarum]|uniref:DUF192 domain-containing protein n=1 Tax=Alcanivorax quisquiliarum TaxID=2933565 RepID=A0ABT0E7D8_9GAMM|nr:DUF192 domain-containing protein [Alcanivorax quisquiliarum]MCK0537742.1 DUF192 domain-containing protein [Alcanivorax quisquiliarum]
MLLFFPVGPPVGAVFGAPMLRLCLGDSTVVVTVEIAANPATRQKGLMLRKSLEESSGMLFLYQSVQPVSQGFWMYQVQFPLDIAFISADNKIVSITQMEPCLSSDPKSCPAYYSEKPYKSALEVNAGFFAAAGIEVGDKVRYAVDGKCEHQ